MEEQKTALIKSVFRLFEAKGADFKMDDVAADMKMSKKTIYKVYGTKEDLILLVVDAIFEAIENKLQLIIKDESASTVDKLIAVTCAHPDIKDVDMHVVLSLKDAFPLAYKKFIHYIEDNWNLKESLYHQGIREGVLEPVEFKIFKCILLGTIKQVLEASIDEEQVLLDQCIRQAVRGFMKVR